MNVLLIAWRNMQQRGLATFLTMLSMGLGVALVVLVLSISWIITETFERNSNVGYNLIVGAKGGTLQLALNTVFYLSEPIEVIPYEEYLELIPGSSGRQTEIAKIGGRVSEPDRKGIFSTYTSGGFAIPVCLGDYFGPFRVVATDSQFFEKLRYGRKGDLQYQFASGRNLQDYSAEYGYFEAVLGAQAASFMNKQVGDTLQTTHGDPEGEGHGQAFTIVGILKPTGTPNDRAAFINLEGFYLMEGHARQVDDTTKAAAEGTSDTPAADNQPPRLPLEQRDLTAVLVKPGQPAFALHMERSVNKRLHTQAVSPVKEISNLIETFIRPLRNILLALTIVVCIASAISILVSIYNSMNERRRDIAVMRALGARRDAVMIVVLLESMLIAIAGGLMGWLLGHGIGVACSGLIEERTGIQVGFFNTMTLVEWLLVPGLVGLATLAGIIPALVAYRTDVSENLGN